MPKNLNSKKSKSKKTKSSKAKKTWIKPEIKVISIEESEVLAAYQGINSPGAVFYGGTGGFDLGTTSFHLCP